MSEKRMMKAKKGFILRRLGQEYMVVPIGEASKNLNGMIRMNETGAFLWKELENGITAHKDLREYLETMEIALEREEGE